MNTTFPPRLSRFSYTITHVPGKLLYTADTLSRSPSHTVLNDTKLQEEAEYMMELTVNSLLANKETQKKYQEPQHNTPSLFNHHPIVQRRMEERQARD